MKSYVKVFAKRFILMCADLFLVLLSLPIALYLRLDTDNLPVYFPLLFPYYYLTGFIAYFISFLIFKPYRTILRLANLFTALRVSVTICCGGLFFYLLSNVFNFPAIPRSVYVIQILLLVPGCLGIRFSLRIFDRLMQIPNINGIPTLIYGAGLTTDRILPMLLRANHQFRVVGIVDDDAAKKGSEIQGIRILGGGKDIERLAQKHGVTHVLLSMPSIPGDRLRQIVKKLYDLRLAVKILPSPESYINDASSTHISVRDLDIEDLLRRTPRRLDKTAIANLIHDQTVLVTGAGGSIGSELARQIAAFGPRHLILNDSSEYALYTITEELTNVFPNLTITPALANLTDEKLCAKLFNSHTIDIAFHACAYKHVPLLEENIISGVKNNLVSAENVFTMASKTKVKKVVLISSDKAVRPTNVMGATKRACELLALWYSQRPENSTSFACVRFGNVLGSSGSVLPKFLEQIKSGGPITITHPEITRYFMLIPEAVSLVLQATTADDGFATYLLNMGKPIKIVDMAKDLLQLMGKQPDLDIKIVFTGLRPGEKLYEELSLDNEHLDPVTEDFSRIANQVALAENFRAIIDNLHKLCDAGESNVVRSELFKVVHFYEVHIPTKNKPSSRGRATSDPSPAELDSLVPTTTQLNTASTPVSLPVKAGAAFTQT